MKKSLLVLTLSSLLVLSSCSLLPRKKGDSSSSANPTSQTSGTSTSESPASSSNSSSGQSSSSSSSGGQDEYIVTLSQTSIELDANKEAENHTYKLEASVSPAGTYEIAWRSNNASIASVKQDGTVTGEYKGSTEVYAQITVAGVTYKGYCDVEVKDTTPLDPKITGVSFATSDKNPWLDPDEEKTYRVDVSGTDGHDGHGNVIRYNHKVSFACSETDIVKFEEIETGEYESSQVKITALKGGDVTLTATAKGDSTKKDTLSIHVEPGIVALLSVVSHPSKIAKGADIASNSVVLKVKLDDDSEVERYADNVIVDSSTVGLATAKAYINGVDGYLEFDVTIYEGQLHTFLFTNKQFDDETHSFDCVKEGAGFDNSSQTKRGIQVTYNSKSASAISKNSYSGVLSVGIVYSTNKGNGSITLKLGDTIVLNKEVSGEVQNEEFVVDLEDSASGLLSIEIKNTGNSNSVYLKSISISQEHRQTGIAVLSAGKSAYKTNEVFDFTDYVVVPNYTDGIGDESEEIDHSLLTINFGEDQKLNPSDTKVVITQGTYETEYPISVSDVLPNSFDAEFLDTELLDPTGSIVLYSETAYTLHFDVEVDEAATHHDYGWTHSCSLLTTNNNSGEVLVASEEYDPEYAEFSLTVSYTEPDYFEKFHKAFTIKMIDKDDSYMDEVIVSYDSASIVTTQYFGKSFNYTGFTFTAHYTNGGESKAVYGSQINWDALAIGVDPHGTYTDEKGTTVDVDIPAGLISVVADALTITISGDLTKKSYELSNSWSVDGLVVTGQYASGDSYTLYWTISFSPETPASMGVTTGSNLTITFTSKDGSETSKSTTIQVVVVADPYQNSTGLAQGSYYIANSSRTSYLTGIKSGDGTIGNKSSAMELNFKLVGDDTWEVTNSSNYYMKIGTDDSSALSFVSSKNTVTITWDNQDQNTRKVFYSTRGLSFTSSAVKTYALSNVGYDFGIFLEPTAHVTSITSITGSVRAKLGSEWSTSSLVVNGIFEGNPNPQPITSLVDFIIDPTRATSKDITEVSVTANLRDDPSITYTTTVAAIVDEGAVWQQVTSKDSFEIGMNVVIVYNATKQVMNGVSTSNYGTNADFDEEAETQTCTLVVEAGKTEGTYAFRYGSKYLACNSAKSLTTVSSVDTNSSWTVSFDDDGNVLMSINSTCGKLQYNSSSPRFACYTSSQKAIQLYAK